MLGGQTITRWDLSAASRTITAHYCTLNQHVVALSSAEPSFEPGEPTDTLALWQEKAVHAARPERPGETAGHNNGSEGERREAS